MRQRGFTLIEVLFALLILAIVITTTLLIFVDRTRRLQQATETILAYQSLSNEAEVRRRIDFSQLDTAQTAFISDTHLLSPLQPFQPDVTARRAALARGTTRRAALARDDTARRAALARGTTRRAALARDDTVRRAAPRSHRFARNAVSHSSKSSCRLRSSSFSFSREGA